MTTRGQEALRALEASGGRLEAASRVLGITKQGLADLARRQGIDVAEIRARAQKNQKTREQALFAEALRKHDGRVTAAARSLGWSKWVGFRVLKEAGLDAAGRAREEARRERRDRYLAALEAAGGNVARAARELGETYTSVHGWLREHGLLERVEALRKARRLAVELPEAAGSPGAGRRPTSTDQERLAALEAAGGNIAAAAAALRMPAPTLYSWHRRRNQPPAGDGRPDSAGA